MSNQNIGYIQEDNAIEDETNDLFGYGVMADYLIRDLDKVDVTKRSYSVGITGYWGIGKSSFLNLFANKVENTNGVVVRFYPRSSAKIEYIQDDFFDALSATLKKYYFDFPKLISKYIRALKLLEGQGLFNNIMNFLESLDVDNEKERINTALKKIDRRIYVIIEDLDRLSGKEIIEVMKLIDRNGDFCNVIFLSAYDKMYVHDVLHKKLGHKVSSEYTDKYFNYELPMPVQKELTINSFIINYLQKHTKSTTGNTDYDDDLYKMWRICGTQIVQSLENIRHVKRFLNLFMSRYTHVKDDVNIGDFILLTLIRYKNINIYNAIIQHEIVFRGGLLGGSNTTIYLSSKYKEELKELQAEESVISILERLFPKHNEAQCGEGEYKRLRRSESFSLYFYDHLDDKIYYKDMAPMFEEDDDSKALSVLDELMKKTENWASVEEYLRYREISWVNSNKVLKRYIKLIILTYHRTGRNINYYSTFGGMLYKSRGEMFVQYGAAKDLQEYTNIMYQALDDMVEMCADSIGLFIVGTLEEFQKHADKPDSCIFSSKQYVDLAMKCLKYYTENAGSDWKPTMTIALSSIVPFDGSQICDEAREYVMDKIYGNPKAFADGMFSSHVKVNGSQKILNISFVEPYRLKLLFGNWETEFPKWIETLPNQSMKIVFKKLFDEYNINKNVLVRTLKDAYEPNDYIGLAEAIEKADSRERDSDS